MAQTCFFPGSHSVIQPQMHAQLIGSVIYAKKRVLEVFMRNGFNSQEFPLPDNKTCRRDFWRNKRSRRHLSCAVRF